MKRTLAILLSALLLLSGTLAAAEAPIPADDAAAQAEETLVLDDAPGLMGAELDYYEPSVTEIALGGRVIPEEPTHLTVGNATQVNGAFFTAQFGSNTSDIDVRAMLHGYDPVVWSTQLNFVVDPLVVKSLSTSMDSDGNSVYIFTLCDDLRWNDGTPITAADYVFAYLLQASPQFAQIGADIDVWQHLAGYEAYAAGETDVFSGVHLLAEDCFSLTVKAAYLPSFYELSMLSITPSPIDVIAPGCTVKETAGGARIANLDSSLREPVFTAELLAETVLDPTAGYLSHPGKTCGPYSLTGYDAAAGVVDFEMNPWYKGNYEGVKPVINTVTLKPVKEQELLGQLERGEIDLVNKVVNGAALRELSKLVSQGFGRLAYARLGYGFLTFAAEQGPQQFQAVRQAIAYAFDADRYISDYLTGFGLPVYGYYGLGQWMTEVAIGNLRPDAMTEEDEAIWNALNLDTLTHYDRDLNKALRLLEQDGWTLNAAGEPFDAAKDTLRCKAVDGTLMPLRFTFGRTVGNDGADLAIAMLEEAFQTLGAALDVTDVTFPELLDNYFGEDDQPRYDMSFMATNFVSRFDSVTDFYYSEEGPGSQNVSRVQDEALLALAWDMHLTEPGDTLSFMQKWIAFQERFNEVLPTLPIYSNVYMDFFTGRLQNYYTNAETNWPTALLYAYLAE